MPHFRTIRSEDVEQFLALQNMYFGTKRTMADWNWRSVDNPYVQMATWVGAVGERIVAGYSVVGMYFSVFGRPVPISQSADAVIHPDYRGTGAFNELFSGTMQLGFQFSDIVYGFPNEQSMRPILLNSRTDFILFNMSTYSLRLSLSRQSGLSDSDSDSGVVENLGKRSNPLASIFRAYRTFQNAICLWSNRGDSSLSIQRCEKLPDGYEEFWNEVKARELICIWKDSQYMRWRYDSNPSRQAVYIVARRCDSIVGLVNYAQRNSILYILELLVPSYDVSLGKLLVSTVIKESLEKNVELVKFYGHDRGYFELVFSEFTRQPSEDLSFQAQFNDDALREICTQSLNWSATTGDTDVLWV